MPPPVAAVDPIKRLRIDLASPPTAADLQRALPAVLTALARGQIPLGDAERIARAMCARRRRRARFDRRLARETGRPR
jgi:hypothetical protein